MMYWNAIDKKRGNEMELIYRRPLRLRELIMIYYDFLGEVKRLMQLFPALLG